jgi:hypothetical protein
MFQAVFPAGRKFWRPLLDQLAGISAVSPHWRTIRNLRDAILMIADEAPELSLELVDRLPEDRRRRQVATQLQAGERLQPRTFFWRNDVRLSMTEVG